MALTTIALPAHKGLSRSMLLAVVIVSAVVAAIVVTMLSLHGSGSHVVAHFPTVGSAGDLIRFGRAS